MLLVLGVVWWTLARSCLSEYSRFGREHVEIANPGSPNLKQRKLELETLTTPLQLQRQSKQCRITSKNAMDLALLLAQ
jgi:hypothetical protein